MSRDFSIAVRPFEVLGIRSDRLRHLRRPVRPQPTLDASQQADACLLVYLAEHNAWLDGSGLRRDIPSPFGKPGSTLWLLETWAQPGTVARSDDPLRRDGPLVYRADSPSAGYSWRGSVSMPRWACRLRYVNAGLSVHRLFAISEEDLEQLAMSRDEYLQQWDEMHGRGDSRSNPLVWRCAIEPAATSVSDASATRGRSATREPETA